LETQLHKNNVDVQLNTKVTADDIVSGRPDAVIVATGARPLRPGIPGIDGPNVSSCVDILRGKKKVGEKAVIIGGGCTGGETAEFLANQGKQVTIVEMLSQIAADVDFWNHWVLMDRLVEAGIRMIVNAKVEEVTTEGVRITTASGEEMLEADSVAYAVGAQSYNPLVQELEGRFEPVHAIGDCHTPQKVRQAIEAGFRMGSEI
jgi:pyruvate/2-oxoglutarate dehydrogenase complex dihydrolipoamide dehydrogenase (E3) component